jgi:hypothetical protein
VGTIRVIATCDHCGEEEEFSSAEELDDSEWWFVSQGEMELLYCSRECLAADLYVPDTPDAPPSFY